jgi:hypothetical protein
MLVGSDTLHAMSRPVFPSNRDDFAVMVFRLVGSIGRGIGRLPNCR